MENIVKFFRSQALYLVILFYIGYLIVIFTLLANNLSSLVNPLITPMTLVVGIFIWQWQEDQKNKNARSEEYSKKCKERADKLFNSYIKYERSIQKLYRMSQDLRRLKSVESLKRSQLIVDVDDELKTNRTLEDDFYFESVLFYSVLSKKSKVNIYENASNLNNKCCKFKYLVKKLEELCIAYNDPKNISDHEKTRAYLLASFNVTEAINHLNFDYSEEKSEVVYTAPREEIMKISNQY